MKGKKLRDPIIYSQRLPEGTDSDQPRGAAVSPSQPSPQAPAPLGWVPGGVQPCRGGQARLLEPHSPGALGNSLLQSNSLPACMCAFVRNVHEVRVPRTHAPLGFPTLRADTLPSPGEKAFCATWDEEQGSCGREDDPAGRMVHLGAAVD